MTEDTPQLFRFHFTCACRFQSKDHGVVEMLSTDKRIPWCHLPPLGKVASTTTGRIIAPPCRSTGSLPSHIPQTGRMVTFRNNKNSPKTFSSCLSSEEGAMYYCTFRRDQNLQLAITMNWLTPTCALALSKCVFHSFSAAWKEHEKLKFKDGTAMMAKVRKKDTDPKSKSYRGISWLRRCRWEDERSSTLHFAFPRSPLHA